MTHKLLVFNRDHADEHNVPALACMTNDQYVDWLDTPAAIRNEDYDGTIEKFTADFEAYQSAKKQWQEKGLYTKQRSQFTDEETQWANENPIKYINEYHKPVEYYSKIIAYLGNGSDGFSEQFDNMPSTIDFVNAGIVKVFDVSEEFYNMFHTADLSRLSLCNIFKLDLD